MISKRTLISAGILVSLFWTDLSRAQVMSANYGAGIYGGAQPCPYPIAAGEEAFSKTDEAKEFKRAYKQKKKELGEAEREFRKLERDIKRFENDIKSVFNTSAAATVMLHMSQKSECRSYFKSDAAKASCTEGKEKEKCPSPDTEVVPLDREPFSEAQWKQYCSPADANTKLSPEICRLSDHWKSKTISDINRCKTGMQGYDRNVSSYNKAKDRVASLKSELEQMESELETAYETWVEDAVSGTSSTEGRVCVECLVNSRGYTQERDGTDWGSTLLSLGLGVAGIAGHYKTNKMMAEYNSSLGFATQQNYLGYLPGLYSVVGGIYGALSGGTGRGAFGCMSGPYNNGNWNTSGMVNPFIGGSLYYPGAGTNPFAYPGSMYNNPLASLFNQGLSPFLGANASLTGGIPGLNASLSGGIDPLTGMMNPALGLTGMNPALGINGMLNPGMGGNYNLGAMQYQQQMIQMQLQAQQQQVQLAMQLQQQQAAQAQRALQVQMQQRQAALEVQMQMQQLATRLQQIQYGGAYTGLPGANLNLNLGTNFGVNVGANLSAGLGGQFGLGANGALLGTAATGYSSPFVGQTGYLAPPGSMSYGPGVVQNPVINGNQIGGRNSR